MNAVRAAHELTYAWFACALSVVAVVACGDDAERPMPTMDSGMDAAVSRPDAGPPPMCGSSSCGSPLVGEHCCTEASDVLARAAQLAGRCGADLSAIESDLSGRCVELRQPGTRDDQCPPRTTDTAVELGCCTPDGFCGTLNQAAFLGCQRVLSGDSAPRSCGSKGTDAGTEPDAQ